MTSNNFKLSWEIVPKQGGEPLGSEVVPPLVSQKFLDHLGMRFGLLMDFLESSVK